MIIFVIKLMDSVVKIHKIPDWSSERNFPMKSFPLLQILNTCLLLYTFQLLDLNELHLPAPYLPHNLIFAFFIYLFVLRLPSDYKPYLAQEI